MAERLTDWTVEAESSGDTLLITGSLITRNNASFMHADVDEVGGGLEANISYLVKHTSHDREREWTQRWKNWEVVFREPRDGSLRIYVLYKENADDLKIEKRRDGQGGEVELVIHPLFDTGMKSLKSLQDFDDEEVFWRAAEGFLTDLYAGPEYAKEMFRVYELESVASSEQWVTSGAQAVYQGNHPEGWSGPGAVADIYGDKSPEWERARYLSHIEAGIFPYVLVDNQRATYDRKEAKRMGERFAELIRKGELVVSGNRFTWKHFSRWAGGFRSMKEFRDAYNAHFASIRSVMTKAELDGMKDALDIKSDDEREADEVVMDIIIGEGNFDNLRNEYSRGRYLGQFEHFLLTGSGSRSRNLVNKLKNALQEHGFTDHEVNWDGSILNVSVGAKS